jgi:hypothetical protein
MMQDFQRRLLVEYNQSYELVVYEEDILCNWWRLGELLGHWHESVMIFEGFVKNDMDGYKVLHEKVYGRRQKAESQGMVMVVVGNQLTLIPASILQTGGVVLVRGGFSYRVR